MARYNRQTAAMLAKKIYDRLGMRIAQATKGTNLRQEWMAGFFGVENAQLNSKATRFEAHHYAALLSLRDNGYWISHGRRLTQFNGIRQSQIKDANNDALRALATSYGLAQIMGWHVLNNLHDVDGSQMTVSDLTDKNEELFYIVQLMELTAGSYLRRGDFANVLHIWNTGHAITNGRIETYDPQYIPNASLVASEYLKLIQTVPFDTEANDDDEQAAESYDTNFLDHASPDGNGEEKEGAGVSPVSSAPSQSDAPAADATPAPAPPTDAQPKGTPPDQAIPIQEVAPRKERSKKSIVALIAAAFTSLGIPVSQVWERGKQLFENGNPTGAIIVVVMAIAAVLIYWKYQDRQTRLDEMDRSHAFELNKEKMRIAANPDLYTVELKPNVTPATPDEVSTADPA